MDWRVPFCCVLFAVINLLTVSTGAARLAGVYTKRIATALTLFNVFVLISRMANLLMVPEIGRLADIARKTHNLAQLEVEYRAILGSAAIGCLISIFLIPTFVEVFKRGIEAFERKNSLPQIFFGLMDPRRSRWLSFLALLSAGFSAGALFLMRHAGKFTHSGIGSDTIAGLLSWIVIYVILASASWIFHPEIFRKPKWLGSRACLATIPNDFLILNVFVQAFWSVGWMAAVYAGAVDSQLAITSVSLSGVITGISTILLTVFVDPKAALITDQAAHGIKTEEQISTVVMYLVLGSFIGTLLAQVLFQPAVWLITIVASHI